MKHKEDGCTKNKVLCINLSVEDTGSILTHSVYEATYITNYRYRVLKK